MRAEPRLDAWKNWYTSELNPQSEGDGRRLYKTTLDSSVYRSFVLAATGINVLDVSGKYYDMVAAKRCFLQLLTSAREYGYSEYRTHLDFMDVVSDQFDFNGHIHRRFVEQLKDCIDPNGILAPGKSGIWPAKYRGMRRSLEQTKL